MISKKILRVVAIMVCLGFLTLSISGVVYASDKTVKKPDLRTLLKKPVLLLHSFLHVFLGPDQKTSISSEKSSSNSHSKIKTTGNLKSPRVADQD